MDREYKPKVSIIIPMYNAEAYIGRCVESVIAQTESAWELILVNDGSKDCTGVICDSYAEKDGRILVIHKVNGGVSSARNAGMEAAHGQYIIFIDADDWVSEMYVEHLLMDADSYEFTVCGYIEEHGTSRVQRVVEKRHNISLDELKHQYFSYLDEKKLLRTPFCKRYSRELLSELRFDEHMALGEDYLLNILYFERCKDILILPYVDYHYNLTNEDSATKKLRITDFEQSVRLYHEEKKFRYGNEATHGHDETDQNLFITLLYQMELLSKTRPGNYKQIMKEWIKHPDFQHVCRGSYSLPMKTRMFQFVCRTRSTALFKISMFLKGVIS